MEVQCGCARARQRGVAIVEAAIALPILIVVILGAVQLGLIYQAKATLNHAALQAARAGAVANADPDAIRRGLARGLVPLSSPDASLQGFMEAVGRIQAELATDARVRILNPTRESFDDFGEDVEGAREIPNDRLHARATTAGPSSGLNIQDANILRVEITYGYELEVPLINGFFARALLVVGRSSRDAFQQQLLRRLRLPIVATATVRMHSSPRLSELVVSRADLPEVARIAANTPPSDVDQGTSEQSDAEEGQSGNGSTEPADRGSNLADSFFGFGAPRVEPSDSAGGHEDTGDEGDAAGAGQTGGGTPSQDPPLCTPAQPEQEPAGEDSSLLGEVWDALSSIASDAYEFVRGFWVGIRDQIGDLVAAITDPIETARGVYELAMSFMEDPVGTARTIGAALGQDFSQLIDCGAYDRGRVLGSYVSPAFMLKLATKLARFGRAGLAQAAEETKRELGCASFGGGTAVWSGTRSIPIESLRIGMSVDSRNEHSFTDASQLITRTLQRVAASHRVLATEGSRFAVTDEHPFWVQGRGWTPARDIAVGAPVATASGDTLVLSNHRVDEALEVFNLTVANEASYFVGAEQIWTHNATCDVRLPYHRPRSPSNFAVGASDGGPGVWRDVARPDDEHFRYQQRITGAPREGAYLREYRVNGVDFDGYDAQRNVLLDAKHWGERCPLGDKCRYEPLRATFAERAIDEARRQIEAIRGLDITIEWRVVDEEMALRVSALLDEGIPNQAQRDRIVVIYTSDLDIVDE